MAWAHSNNAAKGARALIVVVAAARIATAASTVGMP
jgi:hypothetical protein